MSYGKGKIRSGDGERGLRFRNIAEHVDVKTVISPLFQYMRWYSSRTPDEVYLLYVDPTEIEQMKLFPPNGVPVTGAGAVSGAVGGPWDRLTISVEDHYLYRSFHDYLVAGKPWGETQVYEHPKYRDDLRRADFRCRKNEEIIESIRENGYQRTFDPEAEERMGDSNEWINEFYIGDEIVAGLDRNGDLLHLKNGRHRLAAAQVLGVEEIPVILSLYHPKAEEEIPERAELVFSS